MNKVIMIGRLTKEVALNTTGAKPVGKFTIAVNRDFKNKDGKYDALILDPFHGSGTLGVCCEKLNREGHNIRWVGIELEKKWCDIANKRIRELEG